VDFGMTIGWPADDPVPRGRMRLDAVLHLERYDSDPAATEAWLDDADARMRAWSREVNERRAPGARPVDETRGWSERMAFLFRAPNPPKGREELMAHLRSLGFGLREPGSRP
jgi:hypothetical protein